MKISKYLKTGELCIGYESDTLTTNGVGSCVVICMWDPIKKIGAMAHMFQPSFSRSNSIFFSTEGASPDRAIPHLLGRMLKLGVKQSNLEIRLIGAGNMFLNVVEGSPMDVGKIILHSTMDALYLAGLPLKSQSVGGNFGRSVTFSISSGLINVNLTNGDNVIL